MLISTRQLQAFSVVSRFLSFSEAARELGLTQSAVSHRIRGLEEELKVLLFQRLRNGIRLTAAGRQLVKYLKQREVFDREIRSELSSGHALLEGKVIIAAPASLAHSVVVQALAPFMRAEPKVRLEIQVLRDPEIVRALGEQVADFYFTNFKPLVSEIAVEKVGEEIYVAVESDHLSINEDMILDTDPEDPITEAFFKDHPKRPEHYERSFMHDSAGIMNGVIHGLGRAIVERRLIPKGAPVRILKSLGEMPLPVFLCWQKHPFYTRLQEKVLAILKERVPKMIVKG